MPAPIKQLIALGDALSERVESGHSQRSSFFSLSRFDWRALQRKRILKVENMRSEVLYKAGTWVSGLQSASIPPDVLVAAKRCIIDVIGVAMPGSRETVARDARDHAIATYGVGRCWILGSEHLASPLAAALANGTAAHALDYDDTSYAGILHATAVVWPACLAAADEIGASGADLVTAFIAGVEIEYALGLALGDNMYHRGCWTTASLGVIGAAAAAARVMQLGSVETTNALAIASCQSFGFREASGTTAKPYLCGRAAQVGLDAALCASRGIAGPLTALDGRFGLARILGDTTLDDAAFDQLGNRWSLVDPGVAIKLYPACSATQAAVEAVGNILSINGLTAEDVQSVVCDVPPLVATSLPHDRPRNADEARFSMPFAIASMLLFGQFGLDELVDDIVTSSVIAQTLPKVSMQVNEALAATAQQRKQEAEGAMVTVETVLGQKLFEHRVVATGVPPRIMSEDMLDAKFTQSASRILADTVVATLLSRLRRIEELTCVAQLRPASVI